MSSEYERLKQEVEQARLELNATKWWQFGKREEAAQKYKTALLVGAMWEIRNRTGKVKADD